MSSSMDDRWYALYAVTQGELAFSKGQTWSLHITKPFANLR